MPRRKFCFNLGLVLPQKPLCVKGSGQINFLRSRVAALGWDWQRGATYVDTIRENWGEIAREALSGKGFGGCAPKVDKSAKCRTAFGKMECP